MPGQTETVTVTTAAGALLLTAVLIVWRRELRAMVLLLTCQGVALAALPIIEGMQRAEAGLVSIGLVVLTLRAAVLPLVLARLVTAHSTARREGRPVIGTVASLLVTALLIVLSFAMARPIQRLADGTDAPAVGMVLAVVFIALFTMATRRRALSQAVGFLMLDNGITGIAFLLTSGVPVIVELGASLDVLFVTLVLGLLGRALQRTFGDTDTHRLRELRD